MMQYKTNINLGIEYERISVSCMYENTVCVY